jgi:uncharacterized protein (DUF305 family)
LITALVLPVAGASTSAAAPPAGSGHHASQRTARHDITFIAALTPHHESAVTIAEVAETRATSAGVRRLAAHIVAEQSAQVREMRAWLARRDAEPTPPPAPVREMEAQDLAMLRDATGVEVDRMFLMMMRSHHAQGVSEAEDELKNGRNDFAVDLARNVKADQTREIARMNDLLAAL